MSANGVELSARSWGPADGQPVLAMHGWLDNAASFDALIPEILRHRPELNIVAWDAAGHGRSAHRGGPYHFVDYVGDAVHMIEALGWTQCSLLGHSMGAGVAALVAGTIPDRIRSLTLVEGLGPLSQDPTAAPLRFERALLEEHKRRLRRPQTYTALEATIEKRAEMGAMQLSSARTLLERATREVEGGFVWTSDPALRTSSRQYFSQDVVLAYFQRITAPSCFIRATSGWPADPERMRERQAAIRGLHTVELEGHHHLHLDTPELVAQAMIEFLARALPEPAQEN